MKEQNNTTNKNKMIRNIINITYATTKNNNIKRSSNITISEASTCFVEQKAKS